jgi:AsmA protein
LRRALKWLAGGVGVLVAIGLIGALALALLLDPVRVRDQLTSVVREQTGRELAIGQPVELSFFPWLGAAVREVRLGNAPGFGDEPLATADELRLRVKVLPLLAGNLELDAVVVRGLGLNLARNAQGLANWADPRGRAPTAAAGGPTERASTPPGLAVLLVGGVELTGARVAWRDERAGTAYLLDEIELATGAIAAGLEVPVRFGARARAEGGRDVRVTGTARLALDEQPAVVRVADLATRVVAAGEGLPAAGVELAARAGLRYELETRAVTVAPLEITGPGLRLGGEVRGARLAADPAFEGVVEVLEARPRTLLPLLGVAGVATADPAALERLTARLPFKADARALAVDGLRLTLDDTTLTGRLAVTDLAAGAVRFDLAADRLDLDRYLPPPAKPGAGAGAGGPKAAGAVVAGGAALPTEVVRGLDLDGGLQIGALKLGGARLSELRTHWHAKGGKVTQTAQARLYGGSADTRSTLDANGPQPAMTLKGALQGVDLAALLADTTGRGRVSGVGTVEADLRWSGLTEPEIRRSLDGSARLALRDGALAGFDLDGTVRNALAALQGGKGGAVAGQTAFSGLTASLTARNGVLTNRDLKATSALLSLTGEGTIDLPAERIDYLARATLLESAQGLLTGRLADLRDTPIPVRLSGRLDAPTVRLDLEEVLRSKAGQQIQRKVEEKLKGEWGDKLKKFLDR